MWLLLIALAVAALWFFAVALGLVPPPHAKTLIRIRNGQLHVTRGQVRSQSKEFVLDILQQADVMNGYIAIMHPNRAAFSRQIPRDIHQRLRNVLMNNF